MADPLDLFAIDKIVEKTLDYDAFDWQIIRTEYAGHAEELATKCAQDGVDICVAVGGDGTLRETALSVVHTDRILGLLPCGTGNDYARPLGIPTDTGSAIEILLNGENRVVDAGDANGQIFFNIAGFGFDVDVLDYTEEFKPKCKSGSTA